MCLWHSSWPILSRRIILKTQPKKRYKQELPLLDRVRSARDDYLWSEGEKKEEEAFSRWIGLYRHACNVGSLEDLYFLLPEAPTENLRAKLSRKISQMEKELANKLKK
jgi:hypothetical protein